MHTHACRSTSFPRLTWPTHPTAREKMTPSPRATSNEAGNDVIQELLATAPVRVLDPRSPKFPLWTGAKRSKTTSRTLPLQRPIITLIGRSSACAGGLGQGRFPGNAPLVGPQAAITSTESPSTPKEHTWNPPNWNFPSPEGVSHDI